MGFPPPSWCRRIGAIGKKMAVSEEQYDKLNEMEVFRIINQACDIIIDDHEEEVLESSKIPTVLEAIEKLIGDNESEDQLIKCRG